MATAGGHGRAVKAVAVMKPPRQPSAAAIPIVVGEVGTRLMFAGCNSGSRSPTTKSSVTMSPGAEDVHRYTGQAGRASVRAAASR